MPRVEAHREIDIPQLDRYHVLMYLLVNVGELSPQSIENLAKEIQTDTENDRYRPLGEVVRDITGNTKLFKKDPFLNRVALGYHIDELSVEIDPEKPLPPRSVGEPHSLLDGLVGDGPTRPVLIDLYNLTSLGLSATEIDETDYSHTFYPTNRAVAHTKTLRLLFKNLEQKMRRHNSIVLVEQYTQQLIPAA